MEGTVRIGGISHDEKGSLLSIGSRDHLGDPFDKILGIAAHVPFTLKQTQGFVGEVPFEKLVRQHVVDLVNHRRHVARIAQYRRKGSDLILNREKADRAIIMRHQARHHRLPRRLANRNRSEGLFEGNALFAQGVDARRHIRRHPTRITEAIVAQIVRDDQQDIESLFACRGLRRSQKRTDQKNE